MSNDELQKAIDDITSGGSDASATVSDGTATVSLPDDFMKPTNTDDNAGTQGDIPGANNLATAAAPAEPAVNGGMDFEALPLEDKYEDKTSAVAPEMEMPAVGSMPPVDQSDLMNEAPSVAPMIETAPVADTISEVPKIEEETALDNATETVLNEAPSVAPTTEKTELPEVPTIGDSSDSQDIEKAALLELYPLLEKIDVDARKKFDICMRVIEKVGEKDATSAALAAAKDIVDEKEKGECLIRLVEAIDKI